MPENCLQEFMKKRKKMSQKGSQQLPKITQKTRSKKWCENGAQKAFPPNPPVDRKKVPFLEGNMQKNNKQQKTNSDCTRWSAKDEV